MQELVTVIRRFVMWLKKAEWYVRLPDTHIKKCYCNPKLIKNVNFTKFLRYSAYSILLRFKNTL